MINRFSSSELVEIMNSLVRPFFLTAVVLFISSSCKAVHINGTGDEEVFYLLTLLPYYNSIPTQNPSWNGGDNIQPALNLAMDQINKHDGLLENFTLKLIHGNSGCDEHLVDRTVVNFVSQGYVPQREVTGIIGPGCSSSSAALAPLTGRPEVSLVTVHGAGSPTLANRTQYPHLLGTLGSTRSFVQAFYYLLKEGNWSRIAILYDNLRQYYVNTKRLFLEKLHEVSPQVSVEFLSPVSLIYIPLEDIQEKMLRVVFVMCPLELTQYIMCLSTNTSMYYGRYQWVIMSHTLEDLTQPISFFFGGDFYNCSGEQLRNTVLRRAFLLNFNLIPRDNTDLISNTTYQEYLAEYERYRNIYNSSPSISRNSTYSYWSTYLYDAVWAWAVVLDNLTKTHEGFSITSTYGDTGRLEMIVEQFYRTSFQGMSGHINFDSQTGFIRREVIVFQIMKFHRQFITFIDTDGNLRCRNLSDYCNNTNATFIDDSFPSQILRESRGLAVFFVLVIFTQFLIIVVLHIITVKYSKSPSIKASSPNLLHISYAGIYILVAGTFLWALYSAASIGVEYRHYFCQVFWGWTLPVGFTLSFSPVAMRTWRIYRIFEHYLDPGPFIANPFLIGVVIFLTVLNLVLAVSWTAADQFMLSQTVYLDEAFEVNIMQVRYQCTCKYQAYWMTILAVLQIGLLILVTIFAMLTRRVVNSSFATSSLRVLVYLLLIVISLGSSLYGLIILLKIDDRMSYFSFTVLSLLLNVIVGLFIVCVFVPPVIPIFKKVKVTLHKIDYSSSIAHFI